MKKKDSPQKPRVPFEGVKQLKRHLVVPVKKQERLDKISRRELKKPS
ncbi:MAG: hypothetical protein ABSB95_03680 [Dissulfurispiraceae bacterium]